LESLHSVRRISSQAKLLRLQPNNTRCDDKITITMAVEKLMNTNRFIANRRKAANRRKNLSTIVKYCMVKTAVAKLQFKASSRLWTAITIFFFIGMRILMRKGQSLWDISPFTDPHQF